MRRIASRFGRALKLLGRLTWRERMQVALLIVQATLMEIAVRVLPLPKLSRLLGVRLQDAGAECGPAGGRGDLHAEAERRAEIVDRFYRKWPISGSCLRRSLLLGHRLRDLNSNLLIGVARENGELRAHAWVEVEGRAVGREDGDFKPLRGASSSP